MDSTLFQKILDRRVQLLAELDELDVFLRKARELSARLGLPDFPPPAAERPVNGPVPKPEIAQPQPSEPDEQTRPPEARRWPQVDLGALARDLRARH